MLESISQPIILVSLILSAVVGEIILFAFLLRLFHKTKNLTEKQQALFQGSSAKDLESVILSQNESLAHMDKEIQELFEISNSLHKVTLKSVHKVGIVRFNPFKEVGGNQSFSIALLDGRDSGVTVSSIHTREGTRVYAKPIISGLCNAYPLTEEEKQAIMMACKHKPSKQNVSQ